MSNWRPLPKPGTTPAPTPTPTPGPIGGGVLYDSRVHSAILHSGKIAQYKVLGNPTIPNSRALECRASGNPYIRSNADGTFSLICGAGHGRFYGYTINYNATLELVCAWWNQAAGQDISLKLRSRHNLADPCNNRFGGYGFAIDRRQWGAKREPCHNNHDLSVGGSLPFQLPTQQYFTLQYTVRDEGAAVREIGAINGRQIYTRILARQPLPMAYFGQQSYFWVRQNIDSGTGELRIRSCRVLQA